MEKRSSQRRPAALLSAMLAVLVIGCGSGSDTSETPAADRFETTRAHIHSWLSKVDTDGPIMPVDELKETIVDDWDHQEERYQIVSVRRPEDYGQAGHIPNAINMYWVSTVTDENLALLDSTRTLILYCYYGHGSMISATILGLLGYECYSLDLGMMNWNLAALVKEPWDRQADYPVEIAERETMESYPAPVLISHRTGARGIILEMARAYFSGEGSPVIRSGDVKAIVEDWDRKGTEYQLVDVRSAEEYRKGHVPHSIHIPWKDIARMEILEKLDPGRTIIVCSDNGQTGQLAATALNLMGYRTVNMLFGMMDWNRAHVARHRQWKGPAGYAVVREGSSLP